MPWKKQTKPAKNGMVHHHSNCRRFRCECGRNHEHWPGPNADIRCGCGLLHYRSSDGPTANSELREKLR